MKDKNNIPNSNRERILNGSFIVFLFIIVLTRVLIFFNVNLPFIDSDQPFMWSGVKDYSEGKFYEPRFYGQDYNTFFEALFAVPLFWLGMPVYYALPIATHVLSLFPFLFPAFYLFFHGKKENALLVLAIVLCLPVGYDILNSIPRGFVPGLFLTSFYIISILNPQNFRFIFINTALSIAGYFVNPNSVLLSVPFLFFIFLSNYRDRKYYLVTLAGLLTSIPLYFLFNHFYKLHPSYVILGLEYNMTHVFFWDILSHLDDHFAHISFFVEENCMWLLLTLAVLTYALLKHNKKAFYTFLCFFGIILFSFFSAKTKDGVVWPFYSYSRMFLGIPLMTVLMSSLLPLRSKFIVPGFLIITLAFSVFKFLDFKKSVDYNTKVESRWNGVHLMSLSSILEGMNFYGKVCHKNNVDHLLISNTFWLCTYLNYGGPVVINDFPSTEETAAERRYWVREDNKNKVFTRFIFLSVKYDLDKMITGKYNFSIKRLDDYGLFLIENNHMKNQDFIILANSCESR